MKVQQKTGEKYSSFQKDHGPPYGHWSQEFDELKDNEYLKQKGIPISEVIHPNFEARAAAAHSAPVAHHHWEVNPWAKYARAECKWNHMVTYIQREMKQEK